MTVPSVLASALVFIATAVGLALLLVLPVHRGLDAPIAWIAVSAGALVAAAAFLHTRRFPRPWVVRRPFTFWAALALLAFAAFTVRAYHWLAFFEGDALKVGSPNNLGDLSLHFFLSRYFANGVAWWPEHPQAPWYPMRYYPGMDLFQSLGLLLGIDDWHLLEWTGLGGSALTAAALFEWGGSFTVAGFLFSGGLAGFQVLHGGPLIDYQAELAWKSVPLAIFITQRGFLFALPAGLLLLTHWRERLFAAPLPGAERRQGEDPPLNPGVIPFWVEALLYAVLPLFQLYAFLFLSALLGWWFAVYFARRGVRLHILGLVLIAFLPATYAIALMTGFFQGAGGTLWFEPGWMQHDDGFLHFWLWNFGLFAVLAPALWARCAWDLAQPDDPPLPADAGGKRLPSITRVQDTAAAFVLPAGLLFLFASIVMLSPWDWDNTKLMIWSYLLVLPFLWQRWIRPFAAPVRWPLCAALFLSGGVSLAGGLRPMDAGYDLASRRELAEVAAAVSDLPVEAVFAASTGRAYNHPLVFAGRKLAIGYEGHLYSQGIDYVPLERDLRALMLGLPDWRRAARRLEVRYVYWGPREEKYFEGSSRPWAENNVPVASGEWGAIYDLERMGGQ